jgi:hypothetical protein
MVLPTTWFGVTENAAQRNLAAESAGIDVIVEKVLMMQAQAAAKDKQPLARGTHAKGTCARAQFEVFDVAEGRDPALAARLARGVFASPGVYPATVRFANSDPHVNSDFTGDVRAMSFAVDLTKGGAVAGPGGLERQDFSLQNAPVLPLNDVQAFVATMKVLTASSPLAGLTSLRFSDQLRVARAIFLTKMQEAHRLKPYQNLRYWSDTPYRHGPDEAVKQSAVPSPANPSQPLRRHDRDGLQDELIRHLNEDATMSSFDFGLQLLDVGAMSYWGKRRDADFWIENASVEWDETQAPFHIVGRLTLIAGSQLSWAESQAMYIDVTGHAAPDSAPIGGINRARGHGEAASRKARLGRGQVANEAPVATAGASLSLT